MILDTNALSAWADGLPEIEGSLRNASRLVIPSIVLGEYYFGIGQSRHRGRFEAWLQDYLPHTKIATVGHATSQTYAVVRRELKEAGTPIPANDTWIAALARQHDLPVLSRDTHMDHVKGLVRISF